MKQEYLSMACQVMQGSVSNTAGESIASTLEFTKEKFASLKSLDLKVNKKGRVLRVWGIKPFINLVRLTSSGDPVNEDVQARMVMQLLRRNSEGSLIELQNNLHGAQDVAWEYQVAIGGNDFRTSSGLPTLIGDPYLFDAEFFPKPFLFVLPPVVDGNALITTSDPAVGITLTVLIQWGLYLYYDIVEVGMAEYRRILDGYTQMMGGQPF